MGKRLKALILAGGRGKRLENVSTDINKCMLKLHNRPLISYSLDNAVNAGVDEIIIVVGYRAEDIINEFGNNYSGTKVTYAIQREQKGLVHAIETARDALNGSDFITFLGDEILIEPKHAEMIEFFQSGDPFVVCGVVIPEERGEISKTYAIIQDEHSTVHRLIEKPKKPLNDIQGTGNCIFNNSIFDYIEETPINQKRGEKELVDMIQCAVDDGRTVKTFNIGLGYFNINLEGDIALFEDRIIEHEGGK